jgi:hypothetical protein
MRSMLCLATLFSAAIAIAEVTSSANLGCTVAAPSAMACNGISVPGEKQEGEEIPKLFITDVTVEPGAALEPPAHSDCLLVGINGGDLLNEKPPFLHVDLGKESVTLMPREQPSRLCNKGSEKVDSRMIEIRR